MMLSNTQIDALCHTAYLAGEAIMKVYEEKDFTSIIDFKADNSPLTLADKYAHEAIVWQLNLFEPCLPIISEEGENIDYEQRKDWASYWLIDPLDGTKEFIKRNGEFTVNIALMENNKPVWGIVYAPVKQVLYWGGKNYGAYKIISNQSKSIKVSERNTQLVAASSRSHASENIASANFDIVKNIVVGSSLKFCMVAEGIADVYERAGPTMEWDTAAGHAVLEGAGGSLTMLDGNIFLYNKPNMLNPGFLSSNGQLV